MKRQQEIILILASIFFVTCAWVGFTLYHDSRNSTISEPLNEDIVPINPNFNTAVINQLKTRTYINPQYNFSEIETPTPTKAATASLSTTPTTIPTSIVTVTPTITPTTIVTLTPVVVSPTITQQITPTP